MTTTAITVPVPTDRVPEFYRWFADWVDLPNRAVASRQPATEAIDQRTAANRWWSSLTTRERQVFGLWIDSAPTLLSAEQIVNAMDLKSPRDIPGILSWATRKGKKVGFKVTWRFQRDPQTGAALYGIDDTDYATLLGRARDNSQGK